MFFKVCSGNQSVKDRANFLQLTYKSFTEYQLFNHKLKKKCGEYKAEKKIKSLLQAYLRYYSEAWNEWRDPFPRLNAWVTQL